MAKVVARCRNFFGVLPFGNWAEREIRWEDGLSHAHSTPEGSCQLLCVAGDSQLGLAKALVAYVECVVDVDAKQITLHVPFESTATIFYKVTNERITWATDVEWLLRGSPVRVPYEKIVLSALGLPGLPDESLYEDVRKIYSGSSLQVDYRGRVNVMTRHPARQPKYHDFDDAARKLRALCDERAFAYSGLSVGVLLSGGIDSASVAASLCKHAKRVVGYHWDFRSVIDGDETKFALTTAENLGIDIKLISVKEIVEKGSYFDLDYIPSYAPYSHNFLKLQEETTKMATSDVDVLTTGHLGDDLFGGADVGRAYMLIDLLRHFSLHSIWWILGIPSFYRSNTTHVGDRLFGSSSLLMPRAQGVAEAHVKRLGSRGLQLMQLSISEDRDIAIEKGLMNRNGLSLRHFYQHGDFIDLSARLPASFKTLPFYGVHFQKALPALKNVIWKCLWVPRLRMCKTNSRIPAWISARTCEIINNGIV